MEAYWQSKAFRRNKYWDPKHRRNKEIIIIKQKSNENRKEAIKKRKQSPIKKETKKACEL